MMDDWAADIEPVFRRSLRPICCKCHRDAAVSVTIELVFLDGGQSDRAIRHYCMTHNPDPLASEFL